MTTGLNEGRLVRVSISLAPLAAARRNFGTLLIAGDSDVIDVGERVRSYTDLDSVAADFGTTAPEYLAAALYFGQSPRPDKLMVGRWARTDTNGLVRGTVLSAAQQLLATWTAISTGSFSVGLDGGGPGDITGLDFSGETNLNGVASVITAAFGGDATCTWDGSRFVLKSTTTGPASAVSYLGTAGSGVDISTMLRMTSATASAVVDGMAAETALEGAVALGDTSGLWYGLTFAAGTMPDTAAMAAVAGYIEAATPNRIFGVTETDSGVLDSSVTDDLASTMSAAGYSRTLVQYSANPYAVASLLGRAFSVNFNANRSVITLMFKSEPGVVAETITETQAQTLAAKRCNVFVNYQNGTAIIQGGVMSGNAFIDERHGLDWLANALTNSCYNVLLQARTKVPQTDAGMNQLVGACTSVMAEAVNNGLVAPGVWNAEGFGHLERGQELPTGFYLYAPPIAEQDQAVREQRTAVPIQVAAKLAGAVHDMDVLVNVNR